jgi:polar amino acid transport system substrate-binding protein
MMKKSLLLIAALALGCASLAAKDFKVVVPQLSPLSTATYQKLIEAVVSATGNAAVVQVVPFARSLYSMETNQADIMSSIVAIPDKAKWSALKFDYSTAESVSVVFVVYAKKGKPLDVAALKQGSAAGLKLETETTHVNHFPFAIAPSSSPDASLKRVDAGEIDAFIYSQASGDAALKRLGLKNVTRQYYDTWHGVFLLKKGTRGGEIDKMISDGMAKIKADGSYQAIMGQLVAGASTYIDWQP